MKNQTRIEITKTLDYGNVPIGTKGWIFEPERPGLHLAVLDNGWSVFVYMDEINIIETDASSASPRND